MAKRSREKRKASSSSKQEDAFTRTKAVEKKNFSRMSERVLTSHPEFQSMTAEEQSIVKAELQSERMKALSEAIGAVLASTKLLEAAASNIKSIRVDSPSRVQELREIQADAEKLRKKAKDPKKMINDALTSVRLTPELKATLKQFTDAAADPRKNAEQSYLLAKKMKEKEQKVEKATSPKQELLDITGDLEAEIKSDSKLGKEIKKREKLIEGNKKLINSLLEGIDDLPEDKQSSRYKNIEFLMGQLRAVKKVSERAIREKRSEIKDKEAFKDTDKDSNPLGTALARRSFRRLKKFFGADLPDSDYEAMKQQHETEEKVVAASLQQSKERIKALRNWAFNEDQPPSFTEAHIDELPRPKGYGFDEIAKHLTSQQNIPENMAQLEQEGIRITESITPVKEEIELLESKLKELEGKSWFVTRKERKKIKKRLNVLTDKAKEMQKDQAAIQERFKKYQRLRWLGRKQTEIDEQKHTEKRVKDVCLEIRKDALRLKELVLDQNKRKDPSGDEVPKLEMSLYERLSEELSHSDLETLKEELREAKLTLEEIDDILEIHINIRMGKKIVDSVESISHLSADKYREGHEAVKTYFLSYPETVAHAMVLAASTEIQQYLDSKLPTASQEAAVRAILEQYISEPDMVQTVMNRLRELSDDITPYSYEVNGALPKSDLEIEAEGYERTFGLFLNDFEDFKEKLDTSDTVAVQLFSEIDWILHSMNPTAPPDKRNDGDMNKVKAAYTTAVELALHMHATDQMEYQVFLKKLANFFDLPLETLTLEITHFDEVAAENEGIDIYTELNGTDGLIEQFVNYDLFQGLSPLPREILQLIQNIQDQGNTLVSETEVKEIISKQRALLESCVEAFELAYLTSWTETGSSSSPSEAEKTIQEIAKLFNLEFHLRHKEPVAEITDQMKRHRELKGKTLSEVYAARAEIDSTNNVYEKDLYEEIRSLLDSLDTPDMVLAFMENDALKERLNSICVELLQIVNEEGKIEAAKPEKTQVQKMIRSIIDTLDLGTTIPDAIRSYIQRLNANEGPNHSEAKDRYSNTRDTLLNTFSLFKTKESYKQFEAISSANDFDDWGPIDEKTTPPKGDPQKKRDIVQAAIHLFEDINGIPFQIDKQESKDAAGYMNIVGLSRNLGIEIHLLNFESSAPHSFDWASELLPYKDQIEQIKNDNPGFENSIDERIEYVIRELPLLGRSDRQQLLSDMIDDMKNRIDWQKKYKLGSESVDLIAQGFNLYLTDPIIEATGESLDEKNLLPREQVMLTLAQTKAVEAFGEINANTPDEFVTQLDLIKQSFQADILPLHQAIEQRKNEKDTSRRIVMENAFALMNTPTAQTPKGEETLTNLSRKEERKLAQAKKKALESLKNVDDKLPQEEFLNEVDTIRKDLQKTINEIYTRDQAEKAIFAEQQKKIENKEVVIANLLQRQKLLQKRLELDFNRRTKNQGLSALSEPFMSQHRNEFKALHEGPEDQLEEALQDPATRTSYGQKAVETFLAATAVAAEDAKDHPSYDTLVLYLETLYLNPDDFFGGTPPTEPPPSNGPDTGPAPDAGESGGGTGDQPEQPPAQSQEQTSNPGQELAELINQEDEPDYDTVDLSYGGRYDNLATEEKSQFSAALQEALDQIETIEPEQGQRMSIDEAIAQANNKGPDDNSAAAAANASLELERPRRKNSNEDQEQQTTLAA